MSLVVFAWFCLGITSGAPGEAPLVSPADAIHTPSDAAKFNRHAKGALAPVYPYLAEYIVQRYGLEKRVGIGIDLGSGPGDLILELAKRTHSVYWINADVNPHHFTYFYGDVKDTELVGRVGALFADAQHLPFRDDYADIVVSRGSYHFWNDTERAFREMFRVLKPGGDAFIGRGFSPNVPEAIARQVRKGQKGGPKYSVDKAEVELHEIMAKLGITAYEIVRPLPNADVNYGIWIAFAKPSTMPADD